MSDNSPRSLLCLHFCCCVRDLESEVLISSSLNVFPILLTSILPSSSGLALLASKSFFLASGIKCLYFYDHTVYC